MVARKDGKQVAEQTIRTAGAPHHLVLKKNYQGNLAFGASEPTTFVEVNVVDKDGKSIGMVHVTDLLRQGVV